MYRNKYKIVVVGITTALLSGCAGTSGLPTEKLVSSSDIQLQENNHVALQTVSTINVAGNNSQNNLNVVTRTDTAKLAGLKVMQMGLALFGGGVRTDTFSKENLKGTDISSVANPSTTDFSPGLTQLLGSLKLKPEAAGKTIKIRPGKFKLIYSGLDEETYDLIYDTTLTFGTDLTKSVFSYACKSSALTSMDTKKNYDEWTNNQYGEVLKVTQKLATQCVNELSSQANKDKITQALNGELKD